MKKREAFWEWTIDVSVRMKDPTCCVDTTRLRGVASKITKAKTWKWQERAKKLQFMGNLPFSGLYFQNCPNEISPDHESEVIFQIISVIFANDTVNIAK